MKEEIRAFLNAFEEVFDRDWQYSKEMMGIRDLSEKDKEQDRAMGLESIEVISSEGTFLNPNVDDEIEDWGNRGALLQAYRQLKESLND
ncbi:MAG: hypothetical protein R8G66_24305 [Cytophagales bacterium]|nr:hypothetical protein [Cytophagales bacterium]